MRGKKAKQLRKMFGLVIKDKNIENTKPLFNIRGKVVEVNLWRAFKKEYAKSQKASA